MIFQPLGQGKTPLKGVIWRRMVYLLCGTMVGIPAMMVMASEGGDLSSPDELPVQVDTSATASDFHSPDPIVLQIRLYGPEPISGARVTADMTSPASEHRQVILKETAGSMPQDVVYRATLAPPVQDGRYHGEVTANDNQGRAAFVRGMESEPRPGQSESAGQTPLSPFQVRQSLDFIIDGYQRHLEVRPEKTTDLYVEKGQNGCFHLSWTAPLGLTDGARFEIRASRQSLNSETAWCAAQCLVSEVYPMKGGDRQTRQVCIKGSGIYCLAVRSWSPSGLASDISNDYFVELK